MKRLCAFHLHETAEAELLRSTLEASGIPCLLRNVNLQTALGEIPLTECTPELWVLEDDDLPAATRLLAGWRASPEGDGGPWTCRACGERHEGQFDRCWRCGQARSGGP